MTLQQELDKHGITISPAFTGEYIRYEAQFFKGIDLGNGLKWANFGVWGKSNITWTDSGAGVGITPEQQEKITAALAEIEAKRREYWEVVALKAQAMWDEASDRGTHPYLEKKKLSSLHGTRIWMNEAGHPVILVPMRDLSGKLWNVTRIFGKDFTDEKTGEKRGNKFVLKGGRKDGLFHLLGDWPAASGAIFAEGFATGASLKEAFPERTVVVCFDAGNIEGASESLLGEKGSDSVPGGVLFCGDDDIYKPEKGNAGRDSALACAAAIGAETRFPRFKNTSTCPTDWNDLHCLEGLQAVKDQILNPPAPDASPPAQGDTPKMQAEKKVALAIIESEQGGLLKHDEDIFRYNPRLEHWYHYPKREAKDYYMRLIDAMVGDKLKFKEIQSIYSRFLTHVPHVPRGQSMFSPPPYLTNFQNGTLELQPKVDGTFALEFRAKRREDLLCYTHPFDYNPDAPINQEFEDTVARVLGPDAVDTYYEVLGACLLPAFPKVSFFVGKPGTGKSTLILFAYHLIAQDLQCSVDPADWHGQFSKESMAGKLVNLHTDIALAKPIADNIYKLIEDRVPVRISRKFNTDIYVPLPAMHLFGANGMPKTTEGAAPLGRRTIIFRCDKYQPPDTGYIRDWAHHVWAKNPGGVVRRALEGLVRVAGAKGHFTAFDSGKKAMAEWKSDTSDYVEKFLADLSQEGGALLSDSESKAMLGEKGQLTRAALATAFHSWFERAAPRHMPPTSFQLYSRLRELGYQEKMVRGARMFSGFGVKEAPDSAF